MERSEGLGSRLYLIVYDRTGKGPGLVQRFIDYPARRNSLNNKKNALQCSEDLLDKYRFLHAGDDQA